jgi:hypothetical protein
MAPPDSLEAYQQTLYQMRLKVLDWDAAAPFMDALAPKFAPTIKVSPAAATPAETEPPSQTVEAAPENAAIVADELLAGLTAQPIEPDEWLSDEDEVNIYDTL